MTETSTLTAQEMADKIVELEGDVLALRGALTEINRGGGLCREDDGGCAHCIAEQALTDTAQAGREAEVQVLHRWASDQESRLPPESDRTDAAHHAASIYLRMHRDADRLRNGGSTDGE